MHSGTNVKNGELWALGTQTRFKIATKEVKGKAALSWNMRPEWDQPRPAQNPSVLCFGNHSRLEATMTSSKAACSHTHVSLLSGSSDCFYPSNFQLPPVSEKRNVCSSSLPLSPPKTTSCFFLAKPTSPIRERTGALFDT